MAPIILDMLLYLFKSSLCNKSSAKLVLDHSTTSLWFNDDYTIVICVYLSLPQSLATLLLSFFLASILVTSSSFSLSSTLNSFLFIWHLNILVQCIIVRFLELLWHKSTEINWLTHSGWMVTSSCKQWRAHRLMNREIKARVMYQNICSNLTISVSNETLFNILP